MNPIIRTGFFIEDRWTGVRGLVVARPADKYGDYTVKTLTGDLASVQGFNAEITPRVFVRVGDLVEITDGKFIYRALLEERAENGEFVATIGGMAGTHLVHPAQIYNFLAHTQLTLEAARIAA